MKIAITGANGFIGEHVINEALEQGHQVWAIARNNQTKPWQQHPLLTLVEIDLLEAEELAQALRPCEALVHLAAVMEGPNQYRDSMMITKNVLAAMNRANVNILVALSSIAVLDYAGRSALSEIDESVPLALRNKTLGPYAKMKRDQERLYTHWQKGERRLIILRPGLVYDKQRLSNAHVGFKCFAAKHPGEVPLVHVKAVASAVIAALKNTTAHRIFHLINDNPPNQSQYLAQLKEAKAIGSTLSLPWKVYGLLMTCCRIPLQILGKCPDALRKNSIAARQKPFRFSNRRAKQHLKWHPHQGLKA